MLKISTTIEYDTNLKDEYRIKYEKSKDSSSLHKYLLCLLTDEEELQGYNFDDTLTEIKRILSAAVEDENVQNYEIMFYYELCRSTIDVDFANNFIVQHPGYAQYCKLNALAYFFLKEIRLLDAAEKYLYELYNVLSISYEMFCYERVDLYRKRDELRKGYDITKEEIIEASYYAPAMIFNLLTDLAIELKTEDNLIEFYHNAIEKSAHVKWISQGYIKLCQSLNLSDEISAEYKRLKDIVIFIYKDDGVNKKNSNFFSFFCGTRELMGLSSSFEETAKELGIHTSVNSEGTFIVMPDFETEHSKMSKIWINDIFKAGNKSFLKRVTKMSKPLKTHFKVFANQEKEIIFSKSIFANIISLINHRFVSLFNEGHFIVTDYDIFYEAFPFYELNGFTEDEIDEICNLLSKIYCSSIQLNPYVNSHSFTACPMLVELLSVNTTIDAENKLFEYKAYDESSGQLTVFGIVVFLTTFLTKAEKLYFASDLAGSDYLFSNALMKQIFDTIPSATPPCFEEEKINQDLYKEKTICSLIFRKELFRFLLEFEAKVLRKHNVLDESRPSFGALSFSNMLSLEYDSDSIEYINLTNIHFAASSGVEIEENYNSNNILSIQNIVNQIEECIENNDLKELFQEELEALFNIFVNRKYYNYLKWLSGKYISGFLSNYNSYCNKMLYRNEHLMTEDDEYLLYDCTKERTMSYLDDNQRDEIQGILGSKSIKWKKLEITILDAPEEMCHVTLNDEFLVRNESDRYIQIKDTDNVTIEADGAHKFIGYEEQEVFNSPIARFIIRKALISEA